MGRTKRKRRTKKISNECRNPYNIIELQKSIRIKCPKLKVHYFNDTGWGMKCKANINENDVLIALPLSQLITPSVQCDVFNTVKRENLSPQCILSLFLIYEVHLQTKSEYFNYINTLPKTYTNLYFCTKEEVRLLPNFLKEELLSKKLALEKNCNLLFNEISGKICTHCKKPLDNIFTNEKLVWAWFTVNTRSVYYQDDKNFKSMALAPFLDMFNHSNNAETKMIIDFKNDLYVLKTLVKYRKYDQIFIKYGAHSNLKLLSEYGFILPNNVNDFVEFSFQEIIESAKNIDSDFGKLTELKCNFIDSNRLNKILTKSKEFFSWSFNGLVWVLITKDEDLLQLQSKIFSNNFTSEEEHLIQKIGDAVATQKALKLQDSLKLMNNLKNCSVSFFLAKNLVEIYINILHSKS